MLKNLFPIKIGRQKNSICVHRIIAFPVIILLALAVGIFSNTVLPQEEIADNTIMMSFLPNTEHAQSPLKFLKDFTGVDVMKLTKDVIINQPSAGEIDNIVQMLSQTHPQYIAISIPLDASADYPGPKPSPQSAENFTKTWANAIHNHGLKILWRGTWSGIEGLYNFPKKVGPNRFPAGTALSATTDENTTWLGKTYGYIINHPDYFQTGDIWAPMPERTEGIFQDQTSFLPYKGGIQNNYALFFNNLKKVSDLAFSKINKNVNTGLTANNFSEVASGWIPFSVFNTAGLTAVDYYGSTHTPEEMEKAIRSIYTKTHNQIFLEEWSDYWNENFTLSQRQNYLASMYAVFQKLANEKILMGFNYWGGWPGGTGVGILDKTSSGYKLNAQGLELAKFFEYNRN